ncbi:MAG TPA: CBS domain-containing protein, partial [Acidimicrobiia bacterium]|nr:CBS domain-containing protein [Acidimicrobiia bacterium]
MATTVREVMTGSPVTLPSSASVAEAAALMREHDIGDVLVVDGDAVAGIVTDRDIVVRAVADGGDPREIRLT